MPMEAYLDEFNNAIKRSIRHRIQRAFFRTCINVGLYRLHTSFTITRTA